MFAAVEGDVEDRVPSSAQESRFEGISPFPRSSTDTLWLPSGAVPPIGSVLAERPKTN
jgi:hypothetical protein